MLSQSQRQSRGDSQNRLKEDLLAIFQRSQTQRYTQKCVSEYATLFNKKYNTQQFDGFMQVFMLCIKAVLISERTNPFTKRSIEFISLCFKEMIAHEEKMENERLKNVVESEVNDTASNDDDEDEEDVDELGTQAFDPDQTIINTNYLSPISSVDLLIKSYFIKFLFSENLNVRYNTTSLIKKTLEHFSEIDHTTFIELRSAITDRSFDKEKTIRALAVLALDKLQNSEKNDPASKALKFHLLRDPDQTVRLCALKTIEVNTETLSGLFLATRDSNNSIRKTAYMKIATNCEIFHFSTDDRHTLLMNGMYEREPSVKETVFKHLIPSWIKKLGNNILKFVEYLNIKRDLQFCENFLFTYFSSQLKSIDKEDVSQFHKMVLSDFKAIYLDEYQLLTKFPLTEENVFFWLVLCTFCKKNSIIYKVEEKEVNPETGEEEATYKENDLLDDILPDIPHYCLLIKGFATKMRDESADTNTEEKRFIFLQLLKIGKLLPIKDDAQWKCIKDTFQDLILVDEYFDLFDSSYIQEIIEIFSSNFGNDHNHFLEYLLTLINNLNNPEGNNGESEELQKKLDEFEECLSQKYEMKSNCLFEEKIEEAARIKIEIDNIISEKQMIIDAQQKSASEMQTTPRMETDSKVFQRCAHICYGFFFSGELKKDVNMLPTIVNKIVLPGLENADTKIRTISLKSLGLYCLPSIDLINYFIKVFIEISDSESYGETRVEALKYILDFLCSHGFNKIEFTSGDYKNTDLHKSINFQDGSSQMGILGRCGEESFIEVFSDLVDKFLNEPRYTPAQKENNFQTKIAYQLFEVAVKGLCKLLDMGRLLSKEFLARLIVIYFKYEHVEPSLKQLIEGFFFMYSQNFPRLMEAHFGEGNAFVGAFDQCLTLLFEEMQVTDTDGVLIEKLVNFFYTFIDDQKALSELAVKATSMLIANENSYFWAASLKLISTIDLEICKEEQLREMENSFTEFIIQQNGSLPEPQPSKRGRGRGQPLDKNVEMARKILTKIEDKLKNYRTE